ncbi:MAG: PfkB family carbohydrate kinase [Promethearchaeota archaeon]
MDETRRALVLGSIAFDYIMDSPENYYDAISIDHDSKVLQGTFLSVKKIVRFGGTAGNIAYNMAKLGGKPIVTAAVGEDFQTFKYDEHLKNTGVDARVEVFTEDTTASCYIFNDVAKNQLTVFHGGALNFGDKIDLKSVITGDDNISIAINAPNNMAAMTRFSTQLKERGIPAIFDPGQILNALTDEQFHTILENSSAFISNDHEFKAVKKRFGVDLMERLDVLDWIITTKGAAGSTIYTRDDELDIPVVPAGRILDPTGAGDAFRGGLLRGLTGGLSLKDAARVGAVMGSINVEQAGGQGVFELDTFRKRYEGTFGGKCPV